MRWSVYWDPDVGYWIASHPLDLTLWTSWEKAMTHVDQQLIRVGARKGSAA